MDITDFESDPLSSVCLHSTIDTNTLKKKTFLLGIDEAGRGPVLGPMVYSAFFCDESQISILQQLGCADSKQLTEVVRSNIFSQYESHNEHLGFVVKVLSPHTISTSMLRRNKYNLNDISHDTAIELIQWILDHGVDVTQVFVDTVGDPDKYALKLRSIYPKIKVCVSKKADDLYPIVSASSICAKVIRDQIVENWKLSEYDKTFVYGSGYPSDPNTKSFLTKCIDPVFGFPKFVRFSWSTATTIMDIKCVKVLWDDSENEETSKTKSNKRKLEQTDSTNGSTPKSVKTLLNYFVHKKANNHHKDGSDYFRASHLRPAVL